MMRCLYTLVFILPIFNYSRVWCASYDVTIETLKTGTNGVIRIKFIGILGESNFVNIQEANYFSKSNDEKSASVEISQNVDSLLRIALTVVNGHSANIGRVTIVEKATNRRILFDFQASISEGNQLQRDSPSPDLSDPVILVGPDNLPQETAVTGKEGTRLQLKGAVKVLTNSGNENDDNSHTYRWFKKRAVESSIPQEIAVGRELLFESLKSTDTAVYFCVMSLRNSVVKTRDLNLVVDYLWIRPLQVVINGGSLMEEGNNVEIICGGSSNIANVSASWSRKGAENPQKYPGSVSHRFAPIHRNDSGIYTCRADLLVNDESREQEYIVDVLYLDEPKILGPKHVIDDKVFILSNETLELTCHSEGNPSISNYTVLDGSGNKVETYGKVMNKFLAKEGANEYACVVSNKYLKKKKSFHVNATSGFKALPLPSKAVKESGGNKFWTTEMVSLVMAAGFLLFLIFICICFVCLWSRKSSKEKRTDCCIVEDAKDEHARMKVLNATTPTRGSDRKCIGVSLNYGNNDDQEDGKNADSAGGSPIRKHKSLGTEFPDEHLTNNNEISINNENVKTSDADIDNKIQLKKDDCGDNMGIINGAMVDVDNKEENKPSNTDTPNTASEHIETDTLQEKKRMDKPSHQNSHHYHRISSKSNHRHTSHHFTPDEKEERDWTIGNGSGAYSNYHTNVEYY